MPAEKPLAGLTVVDLTRALAGPFATLLLGGLGAEVIKVEDPRNPDSSRTNAPYLGRDGASLVRRHEDDVSISHLNRSRNKLGVTLNLKDPRGRELLARLVRQADVLVENFSSGVADRLGVGYGWASDINARLIYCSISGFGQDHAPGAKAMDAIIQALSGLMMTSGAPDDPPIRVGIPTADLLAPLFGVIGVLAALEQRHRTGRGQHVDISMLGALTSLVAAEPFDLLERLGIPLRTGRTVPRLAPFGVFPAKDGYVAIAAPMAAFAEGVFVAMERPELARGERFGSRDARVEHAAELAEMIDGWMSQLPAAEALRRLEAAGVPCAPVRDPGAAVRDPEVTARGETVPLAHPRYGAVEEVYGNGIPIRFSAGSAGFDSPAPGLGEHNELVFGQRLGCSAEQLAGLHAQGVI